MQTNHDSKNVRAAIRSRPALALVLGVSLLLVAPSDLSAALISYDGAAYESTNSLSGASGGAGWQTAWTGNNRVLVGGLKFPGLMTANNRFSTAGAGNASFRHPATNGFGHLLRTDGRWGRVGTELWLSFLARRETSYIADYAGLSLFNNNIEQVFMGTPHQQERWGFHVLVFGGGIFLSSRPVVRSETVLLVTRLTFGPTSNRVDLFINPLPGAMPAAPDASHFFSTLSFDRFRIEGGSSGAMAIDEIRFGENYADVTPVVSEFAALWAAEGTNVITRSFTNHLLLAEPSGAFSNLTVAVTADNPALFPPGSIDIDGAGHDRSVAFHPAPGQLGSSLLTVMVSNAGGQTLTNTFMLEVRLGGVRHFQTIPNTDLRAFGLGAIRDRGGGTLAVTGIVGTVTRALLYWNGPENLLSPTNNALVRFAGVSIVGTNVGLSSDNCWLYGHSHTYRADVTALVSGNGNYVLTNFWKSGPAPIPANVNGVSLLVFHDDSDSTNNRDVTIFEGNDSNHPNAYEAGGWRTRLEGIRYAGGMALLTMHVADGQPSSAGQSDGTLTINGGAFLTGDMFRGTTVPRLPGALLPTLWDIRTENISSFLTNGANDLLLEMPWINQDCVSLVVATVSVPADLGPPGEADLILFATEQPTSVCAGGPVQQSLLISNIGPATAMNVRLNYQLPALATLIRQSVTQGSCALSNGVVVCELGGIAAGATVMGNFTIQFSNATTNSAQFNLEAATTDPQPTNNSVSVVIVAVPPPRLALAMTTSNSVELSWPEIGAYAAFVPEQATNLDSPILWVPVEAPVQTKNARFTAELPLEDIRFFRLRKP